MRMPAPQTNHVAFRGGIDMVTPGTQMNPGFALLAQNYECPIEGGYSSVMGYTKLGDALPGVGPVLGVAVWRGDIYAVREVGDDTASLYRWDDPAWTEIGDDLPVGRYEFAIGNLFATAATEALYMVCPAGKPYKWDGTDLSEIADAMAGAQWIAVHRNHLFLGYAAGSVQFSGVGDDSSFDAQDGAGEIGTQDVLTGFATAPGGVLIIFCQNSVRALYGSSSEDFDLRDISLNTGAKPFSVAQMVTPVFVNERGPTTMQAVDQFGDFAESNMGRQIQPLFSRGFSPIASCVSKERSQYRVWGENGMGVRVTLVGGSLLGITLTRFPHSVVVADAGEDLSGNEIAVFGCAQGGVYQMDHGTSFAGEPIESVLSLAYNHCGSPTVKKRFRRVYIESQGTDNSEFRVLPAFDFGSADIHRHRSSMIATAATGASWDLSNWDEFAWSGPYQSDTPISIEGTAVNMSLVIYHASDSAGPHSLKGYTVHYTPRRLKRE